LRRGLDTMIQLDIEKPMIQRAKKASETNYAIHGSKGTLLVKKERKIRACGYVAEEMVAQTFPRLTKVESPHFDFEYKSFKFEVKGIGCNQEPEPHWEATVMEYQKDRKATHFIFNRIRNDFKVGWVLGFVSKEDFYDQARLAEKGTKNQNFTYDNDRHCIEIRLLSQPDEMDDLLDAAEKPPPCIKCGHWNSYMPGQVCGICWLANRAQ